MKISIQDSLSRMKGLMTITESIALEEAMDQYTGQEVKKVYVSIRIRPETFNELKNRVLKGVVGVSTSKYNVSEWFVHRDCLVIMPFEAFKQLNNTQQIEYNDIDKMMANNMDVFFRLYDRKGKDRYDQEHVKRNVGEKIAREMIYLQRVFNNVDRVKSQNLYDITRFMDPQVTGRFYSYIIDKEISSPEQYAERILEFWHVYQDKYYADQLTVTVDDIIDAVRDGIQFAADVYKDESEWVLTDQTLRIPEGSQLIFQRGYTDKTIGFEKMISYYQLHHNYKINFTDYKNINRYQTKKFGEKSEQWKERFAQKQSDLQTKHITTLNNLWMLVEQKMQEGTAQAFTEWETYYEYYINDPDGESERVYEPYIYHPTFQRRFREALDLMKRKWNEHFFSDHTPDRMSEYSFSSAVFDMRDLVQKLAREKGDSGEEENDICDSNYRPINLYRFYRMMVEAVDKLDYNWLLAEYKKAVGRSIYQVLGTRDVKI